MKEGSVYDWFQRRPWLLDIPLAAVLALLNSLPYTGSLPGYWPLLGLLFLTLVVRRTRPALAFAVVSIALAIRVIPASNLLPGDSPSSSRSTRSPPTTVAAPCASPVWASRRSVPRSPASGSPPSTAAFPSRTLVFTSSPAPPASLSAWTLGDLNALASSASRTSEDRAERVERERERELQLAAQQERAAIAREMHDVVAHAFSVIVVQADGAAYAAERSPRARSPQSVAALKTIGAHGPRRPVGDPAARRSAA